jgi:hypothetical protein|tara:strand:+ start:1440 stop:1826 length:387 start_codon:yes stop_codon:yes gene_type:complete
MRVKLTYTADVGDVLPEAANLLASFGTKMNLSVELYKAAIENLRDETFNSAQLHHDLDLLRQQLGELDIRLMEVIQIVDGYEQYQRNERFPPPGLPEGDELGWEPEEAAADDEEPQHEIESEEVPGDY